LRRLDIDLVSVRLWRTRGRPFEPAFGEAGRVAPILFTLE
jgi:hypothetical protein